MAAQTTVVPLTREEEAILIELGRFAQAMITDLASTGSSRYRAPVEAYQLFWNYSLPELKRAVAVAGATIQLGSVIEDGLYGPQTGGSLFVTISLFNPQIPAPPTVASGMPVWYAQNSAALEGLVPLYGSAVDPADLEPAPSVDVAPTLTNAESGGSTVRQLTEAGGTSTPVSTTDPLLPALPVDVVEPPTEEFYGSDLAPEIDEAPIAGVSCRARDLTDAEFLSCVEGRLYEAGAQGEYGYYGFDVTSRKLKKMLDVLGLPVEEAMAQADAGTGDNVYLEIELTPLQVSILQTEFNISSSSIRAANQVAAYQAELATEDLPSDAEPNAPWINEAPPAVPASVVALPRRGFAPIVAVGVGAAALGGLMWAFTRRGRGRRRRAA